MTDLRTKCLVLKRTNYGEFDRIIQVITPDGKKSLIVKGARKEKSKLAGGIELFSLSDITIHHGKADLDILTSARLVKFYGKIIEDYDRLQFAYEALKLVANRCEMVDDPNFFEILNQTLEGLNLEYSQKLTMTWFYLNMAKTLGDELNLSTDENGNKLQQDAKYFYNSSSESFVQSIGGNISSNHIKLMRLIVTNRLAIVSKVSEVDSIIDDCLIIAKSVNKL